MFLFLYFLYLDLSRSSPSTSFFNHHDFLFPSNLIALSNRIGEDKELCYHECNGKQHLYKHSFIVNTYNTLCYTLHLSHGILEFCICFYVLYVNLLLFGVYGQEILLVCMVCSPSRTPISLKNSHFNEYDVP